MEIKEIYIEKELIIDKIKVRGFADLIVEMEDGYMFLYDFKSIGSYPYKMKFGRKKESSPLTHELQLATYGIAVKEEFGRLDGMQLVYYNKDNSRIKAVDIDLDLLNVAEDFWIRKSQEHIDGLPILEECVSPVMEWEGNYCNFKDRCEEDSLQGK